MIHKADDCPAPAGENIFDVAPWQAAQADLAPDLAELAALFGSLDQRLQTAPAGPGRRLALREAADLSWWAGDRLEQDRIALWAGLRIGATDDTAQALARAGWALRRLSSGPSPAEDVAGFLERHTPRAAPDGQGLADLGIIMAGGRELHPIVAAARLFHAWRILGVPGSADMEAAVLAARVAAATGHGSRRDRGQGAPFLPLAQGGLRALRGQGTARARLAAWLAGATQATLAALMHLDRLDAWRARAGALTADLSGATVPVLLDTLTVWPHLAAPLAQAETGASRAAVQRNLARLIQRGLVREVTGQGRYRVWTAVLQ